MNRHKRRGAAKTAKVDLNTPDTGTIAALNEAALKQIRAGQYLDAQLYCRQALEVDPNHADTLHLMGRVFFYVKQYDHALEWISRAIRREPKADYLTSLGTTLLHQGRLEEAVKTFDKAVQLKPDSGDLWRNLGNVLADVGRPADAILSFQQALKLNSRHWDAAHKAGLLLHQLGRCQEALLHFDLCDEIQPNHGPTLQMRALAMYSLDRFEEGLAEIKRANAIGPANADLCNNIGVFLRRLGREEEALPWFDRALEFRPDFLAAYVTRRLRSLIFIGSPTPSQSTMR